MDSDLELRRLATSKLIRLILIDSLLHCLRTDPLADAPIPIFNCRASDYITVNPISRSHLNNAHEPRLGRTRFKGKSQGTSDLFWAKVIVMQNVQI